MNVIYIHTHDTGRFIEPYGYNVRTPNLFGLAREGTLFRQAFSAAPTCSPSRSSMLTGVYPHTAGMLGLTHRGFTLSDPGQHLANHLQNNGMETILCGVQHESKSVEDMGYGTYLGNDTDVNNANNVVKYLENRNKDKNFFLSFGMTNTHRRFPRLTEKDNIDPNYVQPPFLIYDNPETRQDMARYIKSVQIMDECVGIVLDAVRRLKLEDETFIFFTTDHGIAFPGMKCTLYDSGIGVSLMVKFPGNKSKGRAVDSLVSQIDIYPTLCDFLDVPKPAWLEGNSLMPLLDQKTDSVRQEIYAEINYHAAYEPTRCVRTKRHKYIRFFDNHDQVVAVNVDDGPTKRFMLDNGYLQQRRSQEYLFDLYMDPAERINLVGNEGYKHIHTELAANLQNWMERTDDPLLKGLVPKPEGSRVHNRHCISTSEHDFI